MITMKRVPGEPIKLKPAAIVTTAYPMHKEDLAERVATLQKQLNEAPPDNPPTYTIEGLSATEVQYLIDSLRRSAYTGNSNMPLFVSIVKQFNAVNYDVAT